MLRRWLDGWGRMKLVVDTGTRELIGAGDEFEAPRELMVRGELGEKGRGGGTLGKLVWRV